MSRLAIRARLSVLAAALPSASAAFAQEAPGAHRRPNSPSNRIIKHIYSDCAAQTCYAGEIDAYYRKKIATNRNAPLFWALLFLVKRALRVAAMIDLRRPEMIALPALKHL